MWFPSHQPVVHQRLHARRAYFKDVSGWEGADWYAPPGVEPTVERLSWGRQNWFPYWEAEHRATREGVILMDMSFMSKFLVEGRDAATSAFKALWPDSAVAAIVRANWR